jgi:hypothetical protein
MTGGGPPAVRTDGATVWTKRQFLIHMDPEIEKNIKSAAIGRDETASSLVEQANGRSETAAHKGRHPGE